jgi:hypothetical protein
MADLLPSMHQDSLSSRGQSSQLGILGSHLGPHNLGDSVRKQEKNYFNPLPALMYQNVLDLNVTCRAKRTQTYWHVCKFKCPL